MWQNGTIPAKYSAEVRKQIRKRLWQLLREDKSRPEILETLAAEGVTKPDGKPIDYAWLMNQAQMIRKGKRKLSEKRKREKNGHEPQIKTLFEKPRKEIPTPTPASFSRSLTVPVSVELMLEDGDLNEDEKMMLLRQFLRVRRKGQLQDFVPAPE